jgi:hypothetical protein
MPDSGEYPRDFMNVKAFVEGRAAYSSVRWGGAGVDPEAIWRTGIGGPYQFQLRSFYDQWLWQ